MFHWLRPKELQTHYQESQRLFESLNPLQAKDIAEKVVLEYHEPNKNALVSIKDHVLTDAQLLPWLLKESASSCQGTLHWLKCQIEHPIHDPAILKERQRHLGLKLLSAATATASAEELSVMTALEGDVLWALQLPPMNKAWPMPLLFPQWFALRWMNRSSTLLELYHLYRIYGAVASHLIYPLTLFLGPWWYIRTKLKWKLPFQTYVSFLKKGLIELLKNRTGNVREQVVKIATILVYVGVYLYGIIQSIDIAYMLYVVRRQIKQRLSNIHRFIAQTESLWARFSAAGAAGAVAGVWGFPRVDLTPAIPSLSTHIRGIYQLFQSGSDGSHGSYTGYLKTLLIKAYILQGIAKIQQTPGIQPMRWLAPSVNAPLTPRLTITGMAHPFLPDTQQRNPISFRKNLILTGPNAAGKSTYVRSLLANVLLAQTFGICFADKGAMTPIHTIASFMRVYDVIGTQSLFEAECRRSLELIQQVAKTQTPTLLFLDEPMHATPPIEGAATAMALVHYFAKYPHVRLMCTTHYHLLANLERRSPKTFRNISMEAKLNPIAFSYRLQPGASFQSIAIEMLEKDAFPEALLKDAIEIKNKICLFENNESQDTPS
jgi:hypothetical protein